ncbi:hypothetical protein FISHEDRAFT_73583 [Fistulina hepatica ATCC 64428]|uniref:Proteophosphoglycan 5 n=1 Tax=Fistulina hepatica ATCC 64428 TaxID=1128425 RepID=A0A0D7AC93_9AGAR|nr:hypothetical protein FISHEDRAFT_73583 [Fistulina hepatica ATCC 64428]
MPPLPTNFLSFLKRRSLYVLSASLLICTGLRFILYRLPDVDQEIHRQTPLGTEEELITWLPSHRQDVQRIDTGKLPTVDRSVLRKLERLSEPDQREQWSPEPPSPNRVWLPTVTHIPEPQLAHASSNSPACATPPRPLSRLLLPVRIGEQESKARLHFAQILELAHKLNRTVVLPNVAKSRLGVCGQWKFGEYYDADALARAIEHDGGMVPVDQPTFKTWLDCQTGDVPAQLVWLGTKPLPSESDAMHRFSDFGMHVMDRAALAQLKLKLPSCFPKRFAKLDVRQYPQVYMHPKTRGAQAIGPSIADALRLMDDSEVLVVNWDLRYPVFEDMSTDPDVLPTHEQQPALAYAPQLHDLATRLAPSEPYIAVHWRMESVNPDVLAGCVAQLIDVLARLRDDHDITAVWFASDAPLGRRATAKSGTFKDWGPAHIAATRALEAAFELDGVLGRSDAHILELGPALADGDLDTVVDADLLDDPGVRGILDKIIVSRSTIFVSGSRACARASSFTRQIVREREDKVMHEGSVTLNVVEHFGPSD